MKLVAALFALVSLVSMASAQKSAQAKKPQDLIVGRWWAMAGAQKVQLEFAKDGTMKTTVGGKTTTGKYKWLDDTTIELNGAQKVKVTVSADELVMVIGNETSRFEREKVAASMPAANAPTSNSYNPDNNLWWRFVNET